MNDPIIIGDAVLYKGDCLEILPTLEAGSVDSVVTDSPYGLEFMGKKWDAPWEHGFSRHGFSDGAARRPGPQFSSSRNPVCRKCHKQKRGNKKCACQIPDFDDTERRLLNAKRLGAWHETWARECLRVAKPGAYLLAFGGTRTFHRLGCAVEDAGWEIRDCVMWVYGSGFPKSLNVALEFEQVLCECRLGPDDKKRWYYLGEDTEMVRVPPFRHPLANQWAGRGTALKPAWEPIIVARKPLDGTVAANVQKHGTGGMNIDECRIAVDPEADARDLGRILNRGVRSVDDGWGMNDNKADNPVCVKPEGRWPANLVHDGSEEVVGLFPVAAGASGKASGPTRGKLGTQGRYGSATGENMGESAFYGDSGSAARFFYCAKASKEDRDEGLDGVGPGRDSDRVKDDGPGGANPRNRTNTPRRNHHPTVKPTALMRWLVRLVTPPGGIVLDPFMGSGSTGKACAKERFRFLGIELDADYFDIACRCIEDVMTGGPLLAGKPEALSAVEGESP